MRNLFRKLLSISSVLLAIAIFADAAAACSCYATDTIDKEFAKTPNVVVLKLQFIKQNENEATNFLLSVEKVFKGDLKVNEVLTFSFYSNCSWYFSEDEIGTEFLFYLGKRPADNEKWSGSRCSRSGRLKSKTADLLYLENESKLRGKTRLSGRIEKMVETSGELNGFSFSPLVNRKIRITGKGKTVNLVTDENGFYEIYDLPAGKYRITPGKVEGFIFSHEDLNYAEVEIKAKSQTEQNFIYEINNGISGKVIDPNGKPLEDVCVDLISLQTQKTLGYSYHKCTDKRGQFEITAIPIGTYKIVVNKEDPFDFRGTDQFFNMFFYPNVKTEEEAAEISVEPNYFLKNLILIPPEMAETVTLTGRLTFSDGKPAEDKTVQFLKTEAIPESSDEFAARTDKNGRFSLKILKGKAGVLSGLFYSYLGEYKNCPELDEILRQKDAKNQQIETAGIEIKATENLTGIELKFPFPSCQEAEIK